MMRIAILLLFAACNPSPAKKPLPPVQRTMTTRPLMPTSPLNLLRDPLIGGDGATSYGQFRAYYDGGQSLALTRTFQSVSPVGGAVSIEELRDLPAPSPAGVTKLRVISSFLGGAGSFHASIWISAGDKSAQAAPFSMVAPSLSVTLLDDAGKVAATLAAGASQMYGAREWVQFQTSGSIALPRGGWLAVDLTDFSATLELAAPEVTSDAL